MCLSQQKIPPFGTPPARDLGGGPAEANPLGFITDISSAGTSFLFRQAKANTEGEW